MYFFVTKAEREEDVAMGKPTPGQFQVTHSISCLISLLVAGLWIQSEIQSILGLQLFQRRKT